MNLYGHFETHLTLSCVCPEDVERLALWSQTQGWKFVHILLVRGQSISQPMVTFHSEGSFSSALEQAHAASRACEAEGFEVSRLKLEVAADNPTVSSSTEEALPTALYFEHHIKLLLPTHADLSALEKAVQQHGAHLSRNARRVRDDSQSERFVTGRCSGVRQIQARRAFETLLQTLDAFPFPVLETEREFVVFDSNLALDAGWLEEAAPPP